jgi:hypothetical protein
MPTNPITPVPIAYSFARTIEPQKLTGDRLKRLTKTSDSYAASHGLTIDKHFQTTDLGVSAFRGEKNSAIAQWLEAINAGIIKSGSTFLLESLDGQKDERGTLKQILEIINLGNTIVTFPDEIAHDNKSISADPFGLFMSYAKMVIIQEQTEIRRNIARQSAKSKRPGPAK